MSLLIAGSIALDNVKTPFGNKVNILGGSASHASLSASFFSPVNLVGVVGEDFPKSHLQFLKSKGIDIKGVKIQKGKTFHWEGFYEYDMNQAHTVRTDLNVLQSFDPVIPKEYLDSKYVFLANLDPDIQLKIISALKAPKLIVCDTMNFWIENKPKALKQVIKRSDIVLMNDMEARQLSKEPNLIVAASKILRLGARCVIIKKGEHGALLFSKGIHFSAPSYPQDKLIDPTGAGDSFAGGLIGYLSRSKDLSISNLKKAIIVGSVMASFNVEDFSLNALKKLTFKNIIKRFEKFKRFSEFESLQEDV